MADELKTPMAAANYGYSGPIDLDRGVACWQHKATGMDVYMYIDNPGVYLSAHGNEIPEDIAAQAGAPVEQYAKDRKLRLAKEAALAKVMADFQEKAMSGPVYVAEREGFKIVDAGYDRYQVLAPDGEVLNRDYLTLYHAKVLLDQLAPEPPPAPVQVKPAAPVQVASAVVEPTKE